MRPALLPCQSSADLVESPFGLAIYDALLAQNVSDDAEDEDLEDGIAGDLEQRSQRAWVASASPLVMREHLHQLEQHHLGGLRVGRLDVGGSENDRISTFPILKVQILQSSSKNRSKIK